MTTYGPIVHGGEDSFLARARELLDTSTRVNSPLKAAMYTTFPFREFHNSIGDANLNTPMSVAVEKLLTWCFVDDYPLMERSRELCQQLLNEPFEEVKTRMVCFRIIDGQFS